MSRKILASGAAFAVAVGVLAAAAPANAEPAPGFGAPKASDVVGTGSDTTMLSMQAVADAYNVGKTEARLVSFDALVPGMSPTIVLREGTDAVTRPNGSGQGKALLYGASNNVNANFARSSSSLNATEKNAGLLQVPFAADILEMATATTTNAPAAITAADIVRIYKGEVTNWSELGGKDGVIEPKIPQSGSGTRSFFIGELTKANNGVAVVLGANVQEVQEHDPSAIAGKPNVIAPFSVGRARLANTATPGSLTLMTGWSAKRAVYNVFRNAGELTQFQTIFGTDGFICSPAAKSAIEAGGLDQLASVADGGACGEATQDAVTNYLTAAELIKPTTTTLKGTNSANNKVTLTATVKSDAGALSAGKVEFIYSGAVKAVANVSRGTATGSISGLPTGTRSFTARYVPADVTKFEGSTSAAVKVLVRTGSTTSVKQDDVTLTRSQTPRGTATVLRTDTKKYATGTIRLRVKKGSTGTYRWVGTRKTLRYGKAVLTAPKFTSKGTWYINYAYSGSTYVKSSSKTVKVYVR